jgi:NADPH2:quinone reductase
MKAAVINQFGEIPHYGDFPDPVPDKDDTLVEVKACVLENFDKLTVSGSHYASKKLFPQFPAIVGTDGIGVTEDKQLVAFGNIRPPYGAFAEKVAAGFTLPVPEGTDPVAAAAIMPSVFTSLLPLKYSARLQPGETVLVHGATGVSGRIAIQVAKMLGAGKVVGTGRNAQSLQLLGSLGVDEVIDLGRPDEEVSRAYADSQADRAYDVVIDFLWGRPAELLIRSFIPQEASFAQRRIRYVQIGEAAGTQLSLPGSALRTSGLELMGVGRISPEVLGEEIKAVWEGIRQGKFYMDIECVPLSEIASAWSRKGLHGKRLVIVP